MPSIPSVLRKLYTTTPKQWMGGLKSRVSKVDSIGRRDGIPKRLDADYFAHRDPWIQKAIRRVEHGEPLDRILLGFPGQTFDERVVEYPALAQWLLSKPKRLDLLDIGCVLNNRVAVDLVMRHCDRLWFLNPAAEPLRLFRDRVFYHLSPLETSFSHGETFPLVTCISTIEHVGYDNSHYGVSSPAQYHAPADEPLLESLIHIARLLRQGGSCFVTVPFGRRELVTHPLTGKHSSQVFDGAAVRRGVAALVEKGVKADFCVYSAYSDGWRKADADGDCGRYAFGVPAASSVALITGTRS